MGVVLLSTTRTFWPDVRRVLALAIPVILAELGWMAMNVVDTIMVGRLGPDSIGAIGIGGNAFYVFAIFGVGLLLGLDTLVSQAFGAGNRNDCHHSLAQAIYIALVLGPLLSLLCYFLQPLFHALGIIPAVSELAGSFVATLGLSALPLLLYACFRRYLQAMGHVRAVTFALVSANLINWFFNWLLIQGHWGFPSLGVVGSALSTCMARVYLALVLAFFAWWYERHLHPGIEGVFRRPDWLRISRLLHIGLPAAAQIMLEIGAFASAAVLAGRLNSIALAAHQIAISCASTTFMIPLGTASAAAVSVGQAIGRRDFAAARRLGFTAIGLASAFMCCSALAFCLFPKTIFEIYTRDAAVILVGTTLLAWAAAFQLFDGIQTVATGALRGMGKTRVPMLINLGGYWFFGLPIGYLLCFRYGFGISGVWCGLTMALVVIAIVLLYAWNHSSRELLPHALDG